MACTPLLLLLTLLQCTGSLSQPVLTQSPSASAALGASAKLTCTLSSAHKTYTIAWFQQQPGKAPRYLMWLKSDGSYEKGTGVPDRFSGSSSGADRYLTISSTQADDEADYICGADYSGSLSQPVLTQSPSASAALGASAKLTCTLSSAHSDYTIDWYQQQPGKAPRYLLYLESDGSYEKGTGVPDRFSGSSSGADRYLTISSTQAEDEADYICGVPVSNEYTQ